MPHLSSTEPPEIANSSLSKAWRGYRPFAQRDVGIHAVRDASLWFCVSVVVRSCLLLNRSPSLFFLLCLWHPEVPRLGVELELQLPAMAIATATATATPDPKPTEWGQGSNPHPHGYRCGSLWLCHNGNSLCISSVNAC